MRLIITVEVDDDLDATLTDPHEVAEELFDTHDENGNALSQGQLRPYAGHDVIFVGAEWAD